MRLALAVAIDLQLGTRRGLRVVFDVVVADVVLWASFLRTLGTTKVSWRGRELTLERGQLRLTPPLPR